MVNLSKILVKFYRSNEYQQNVTYECDVGYNMRGSNVITCQANKTYVPDPPICIPVSCGLPSKIQFGSVEKSGSSTVLAVTKSQKLYKTSLKSSGTFQLNYNEKRKFYILD